MRLRTPLLGLGAALLLALQAQAATDWAAVAKALGKAGAVQAGGVYRVGLPRSDLKVTLDGVQIKPALALGSWVAFREIGQQAMVMGDLVLTQEEVNPVMKVLAQNGIEITALHNHLLRSSPSTMYMHVDGHGDAIKLATALHAALAQSGTPMGAPAAAAAPTPLDLDTAKLDQALHAKGNDAEVVSRAVAYFGATMSETRRSRGPYELRHHQYNHQPLLAKKVLTSHLAET